MANETIVEPDLQFMKDLIAAGAGDLKKCYQCGACSVACQISPDNSPYPRKEMIWAQWGLKDRLLNDPDVWLCHQCNDCSVQCPRGANPGDVLKAVRKMIIQENSWPSFLGKLVGSPGMFIFAAGIPIAVVLLMVYVSGWSFPAGPVTYTSHSIAHRTGFIYLPAIQIVFATALIFAVVSLAMSLKSYWSQLASSNPLGMSGSGKGFIPSLIESLKEILPHTTFKECETNTIRYAAHLLAFWGFIGLFVTTTIVSFNCDILSLKPPSQTGPGTIPIKMLGNVSAISFVLGLAIMLVRRLTAPDQAGSSAFFDWFFLLTIVGAGATGLLTELSRWGGFIRITYTLFVIHLVFVLALLLYLPFSKFAHLGYRTVAIAWSKSVGRNKTLAVVPNYVPPAPGEAAE